MIEYKIYTLTCPLDGMVKYVGMTSKSLKERALSHMISFWGTTEKFLWIQRLISIKKSVIIDELDSLKTTSLKEAKELEKFWINQINFYGFNLYNKHHNFKKHYIK